jgi:hypothetical protein
VLLLAIVVRTKHATVKQRSRVGPDLSIDLYRPYIKDGTILSRFHSAMFEISLRQPDRSDGAARPVVTLSRCGRKLRSEAYLPVFPSRFQDVCDLGDSRNVFTEQAFQMAFIEGDDVIQQVAAAAAYPALGDTILPGTFEGGPDGTHV